MIESLSPENENLNLGFRLIVLSFVLLVLLKPGSGSCRHYAISIDPCQYITQKFQSQKAVLLGTTHKKPPILTLISDLIPLLHAVGVTHLGLEISSDQQSNIDRYMATGAGLSDIQIPPPIDCPEYRAILVTLYQLDRTQRPAVIALDLPKSMWKEKTSRDEWMATRVADLFKANSEAKMLVILGTLHVLKEIRWQDHVPNKKKSVYGYLKEVAPNLKAFSIGQLIDEDPAECDFTREFGPIDGPVAVDCDDRFLGWKIGFQFDIAIKSTEACELVDGVIIY